jgi:mevalonate kinase
MIKKIKVSAPGKLMLLGEHAVVYHRPCLVAAISQRLFLEGEKIPENKIFISAPEMGIFDFAVSPFDLEKEQPKEVKFILEAIKNFFRKYKVESGLKIKTKSQFSAEYGFGSSSAVSVCTIKALAELFQIKMGKKEIFDLAYKTVLDIQKVGSGFDVAAAVYGGILYFLTGGKIIQPLKVKKIPLIVGYTGKKASTSEIVKKVKSEMEKNPDYYENLFDQIEKIVEKAKSEIENENWKEVGRLMLENQKILRKFKTPSKKYGVSSPTIEKLIRASLEAGAYGAKLSGAGRGDCIIALGREKEKVEKAIKKAGGFPLSVRIDFEGLKIENKI